MEITVGGSAYLDTLLNHITRLAALGLPATDSDLDALATAALVLEGVAADTVPNVVSALARTTTDPVNDFAVTDPRAGSWQDALQLDNPDGETVALLRSREVAGIAAAASVTVHRNAFNVSAASLHAALTTNLVAPARQGVWRQFDVAVHDSGSGRILYQPVTPDKIAAQCDRLQQYVTDSTEGPVVDAAVVLYALHTIQPFDAANGRVALLFARQLLRDAFNGHMLAVEGLLALDRVGFHAEIAQTLHRGDVTYFAQRYAETVLSALRAHHRNVGLLTQTPKLPAALLVLLRANQTLTVKDLPAEVTDLLDAGLITPVAGMHGLKFVSHLAV